MFDSVHYHKTDHIHEIKNITIKKAPTDESIKMYDEFKEKAMDSIIHSIKIDNNEFNGVAVLYKDHYEYKVYLAYKFILNGKSFQGKEDISEIYTKTWEFEESVKVFYNKVSNAISQKLLEMVDSTKWNILR